MLFADVRSEMEGTREVYSEYTVDTVHSQVDKHKLYANVRHSQDAAEVDVKQIANSIVKFDGFHLLSLCVVVPFVQYWFNLFVSLIECSISSDEYAHIDRSSIYG